MIGSGLIQSYQNSFLDFKAPHQPVKLFGHLRQHGGIFIDNVAVFGHF
jgi:hypothetical protein